MGRNSSGVSTSGSGSRKRSVDDLTPKERAQIASKHADEFTKMQETLFKKFDRLSKANHQRLLRKDGERKKNAPYESVRKRDEMLRKAFQNAVVRRGRDLLKKYM